MTSSMLTPTQQSTQQSSAASIASHVPPFLPLEQLSGPQQAQYQHHQHHQYQHHQYHQQHLRWSQEQGGQEEELGWVQNHSREYAVGTEESEYSDDECQWESLWILLARLDQGLRLLSWRTTDAFSRHDTDADGYLSADELRAALYAIATAATAAGGQLLLGAEDIALLVHELAVDGDGYTEVTEVQQALRSVRARAKATAKRAAVAENSILGSISSSQLR
jgi:hypothetical protein